MKRSISRWAKLTGLATVIALGSGLAPAVASAQPSELHAVHILLKSVTVVQDGDPGAASGAGEVQAHVSIFDPVIHEGIGKADVLTTGPFVSVPEFDDGQLQHWGVGPLDLAASVANKLNKSVITEAHFQPGDVLSYHVIASEWDTTDSSVGASTEIRLKVPAPGQFQDFVVHILGSNASGTLEAELAFRIRTF